MTTNLCPIRTFKDGHPHILKRIQRLVSRSDLQALAETSKASRQCLAQDQEANCERATKQIFESGKPKWSCRPPVTLAIPRKSDLYSVHTVKFIPKGDRVLVLLDSRDAAEPSVLTLYKFKKNDTSLAAEASASFSHSPQAMFANEKIVVTLLYEARGPAAFPGLVVDVRLVKGLQPVTSFGLRMGYQDLILAPAPNCDLYCKRFTGWGNDQEALSRFRFDPKTLSVSYQKIPF